MRFSMLIKIFLAACLAVPAFFSVAAAYVGPGTGITLLGTFWVFVSVAGVFIAGLLVWPLRFFRRRRKTDRETDEQE